MSTLDNLIAFRVLYMLVTPFDKTEAFKTGVIDAEGNVLVKAKDRTSDQKKSYDTLDRVVFSLKRLLGKVPGGKSQIASLAAAYYLIKEHLSNGTEIGEDSRHTFNKIINEDILLVEEQMVVEDFLDMYEEMGAGVVGGGAAGGEPSKIANVTGAKVSTDQPVVNPKKKYRFGIGSRDIPDHIVRRLTKKLWVGVPK